MPSFSINRYDALIFAGLVTTTTAMGVMLHHTLKEWQGDAKIKPVQPKAKYITQDTEDALTVSTLDGLLGHYNSAIRETAAKIVCDRVLNDEATIEILLRGITRPDYDERLKNLRALAVITDPNSLYLLHTWKAYTALVRSLELCLDPRQEVLAADKYWDEYPLRDMAEKLPLMFINQLNTRFGPGLLIKAKFVEKWLAKQNWGDTDHERQMNFEGYMEYKRNRISEIIISLMDSGSGREALARAGLIAQDSITAHDHDNDDNDDNDGRSISIHDALLREINEEPEARIMQVSMSFDENRLRRNREAMVFSDGSHPLNHNDIIHRDT
ncbi:hypothetical protein QBC39DRAFT_261737 [Podospora conica]|nr:hypothetical protein QBC39DRAFT_261737 [Schizothecium conicum]